MGDHDQPSRQRLTLLLAAASWALACEGPKDEGDASRVDAVEGRAATPAKPTETPVADSKPAPLPEPPPQPFRVATYNINFSTRQLSTVVELIRRTDADVVTLQETTARSSKTLARSLEKDYPHVHFEPRPWAGGHAILSRVELSDVSVLEPAHGSFGALAAVVDVAGGPLQVVSVHLEPTLPERGASKLEIAAAFAHNESIRDLQIQDIVAALDPSLPHVIAGDFNTLPTLAVATRLADARYIDSQAQDPDCANDPTWHWSWQGKRVSLRIDYIFHGPQLRTIDSEVVPEGPSDHYPLVSTFSWHREG